MAPLIDSRALAVIGSVVFHSIWQGALVAAFAAAGLSLLRRASASTRYALAYASLITLPAAAALSAWSALRGGSPSLFSALFSLQALQRALPWLAIAWLVGLGVASVRLASGWRRINRIRHTATPGDPRWQAAVDAMATRLDVRRRVRLVETALAEVPGAVGWLSPMILFPIDAMSGLNPGQVHLIIAHELAHIRRHDYLLNLIQSVVDTLFFYHPAVHWLSTRIRLEREHCCDDIVVGQFGDRRLYAAALADVERLRSQAALALVLPVAGGDLLARVKRLLDDPAQSRSSAPVWAAPIWLALPLALVMLSLGVSPSLVPTHAVVPSTIWLGAALGFMLGMRHALEPDHLVAVSTLVTEEHDAFSGVRLGAWWGLGHTATLVIGGGTLVFVQLAMPTQLAEGFELAVALMLIALGVRAIVSAWRLGANGPETRHAHRGITHSHRTSGDHVHVGAFAVAKRPLMVGLVHGLAGSGALAALVMASLPSSAAQVAYMILFGLGSTLGMMLLSGLAGLPLSRLARQPAGLAWVSGAAGVLSVVVGVLWL